MHVVAVEKILRRESVPNSEVASAQFVFYENYEKRLSRGLMYSFPAGLFASRILTISSRFTNTDVPVPLTRVRESPKRVTSVSVSFPRVSPLSLD